MNARPAPPAAVILGYVSRPNGLRGAVVIHSDPSMADVITKGLDVELATRQGASRRARVESAAPVRGGVRVVFEDVRDRFSAEALVGATVRVERAALGLGEGEYFDSDLIGLEVRTSDGRRLGELVEVIATGANDIYVTRSGDGREILIPAVAHAVLKVDLEAGHVTVAPEALEYSDK